MYVASVDIKTVVDVEKPKSPLRTVWAIKKFTDGLQRLHHVKWQASRVRRPSKMFTAVASLLAASASRAPKLLGFGLQWQCRSCEEEDGTSP